MSEFYGEHLSGVGHSSQVASSAWPAGDYWVEHDDLAGLLLSAARDNAIRALALYISSDRLELLQAAVAVGAAVELASKAFVASIEPTLLAERGDVDTILHLSGKHPLARERATRIRTLGGVAVSRLARRLSREVVAGDTEVVLAMEVRNSATHMAMVDREELRSRVPAMARIVDSLVVEMGEDRAQFWSSRLELADQLIEERLQRVAQIVEAKRAAALDRLARLTKNLDEASRAIVLASLARRRFTSDHDEEVSCPVCGQRAWLCCTVDEGDPEADNGDVWYARTAWPFEFNCSVCGLALEGDEELAAMQLDDQVELEPRLGDDSDYDPPDRLEETT